MSREKRELKVTVNQAEDSEIITAGRSISMGQPGEQGEALDSVIVDLTNIKRVKIATAGLDITRYNAVAVPLDELVGLLIATLNGRDEKEDVQGMASELLEQAQKSGRDRNYSKIRRLVDGLARYISLATLATTQVEKAELLVEKVQKLLIGG